MLKNCQGLSPMVLLSEKIYKGYETAYEVQKARERQLMKLIQKIAIGLCLNRSFSSLKVRVCVLNKKYHQLNVASKNTSSSSGTPGMYTSALVLYLPVFTRLYSFSF